MNQKLKKQITLLLLIGIVSLHAFGQDTIQVSLGSAIQRAASQSVESMVAKNEYISSYWEYRTYKSELLPEVALSGTLPYYSKSYNVYQNPDGGYSYVGNDYSRIDAGLSITQNIPWTGGKLSVESSTERLQQHGSNSMTRYKSVPASITLDQPVFGFNRIKWLQKIEPVKKKESEQKLIADVELVSNTVITHFFNLLIGKSNLEIARQNLENTQKLYIISEAKRKIGQISENELLQLELSLLKAESALTNSESALNARMFQLRSFLAYGEDILLEPSIPNFLTKNIPVLNYNEVLSLAVANNSFTQKIQRQMLEASRDVSQARSDRWNFSIFASFGMSGHEGTFSDSFVGRNLRSNQIAQIGVKVPILDWGKRKGKIKTAEANRDVIISRLEKDKMDFNQNIYLVVQNFNNQSKQLEIAAKSDKIAEQRYKTSIEAFILGKLDVLNLNDAQESKDIARRNYIEQMYYLWSYYYQIRSLTLYDFIRNEELSVNYTSYLN